MEGGMEDPKSEVKHGWPRLGPVSESSGGTEQALVGALVRIDFPRWLFLQVDAGGQALNNELLVAVQSLGSAQVLSNNAGWLQPWRQVCSNEPQLQLLAPPTPTYCVPYRVETWHCQSTNPPSTTTEIEPFFLPSSPTTYGPQQGRWRRSPACCQYLYSCPLSAAAPHSVADNHSGSFDHQPLRNCATTELHWLFAGQPITSTCH